MPTPKPYDVKQYGTDTSGRPVLMNARMALALEVACRDLDFTPLVVQGSYMSRLGGGAADSAGYHDAGGCLDFRTWNLTADQQVQLIHALRSTGWAAWVRDDAHGGMDEHCHVVLMGDKEAASGALDQMAQYRNGTDGLSSRGPDYHWRPDPLVTDFDFHKQLQEDRMLQAEIEKAIKADGDRTRRALNTFRTNSGERDQAMQADIDSIKAELADLPKDKQDRILARLAAIRAALAPPTEETP